MGSIQTHERDVTTGLGKGHLHNQPFLFSNSPTCCDPVMQGEMEEQSRTLGTGPGKLGLVGLLWVVVSHPTAPILENAAGRSHPLVTFAVNFLEPDSSPLGQTQPRHSRNLIKRERLQVKLREPDPRIKEHELIGGSVERCREFFVFLLVPRAEGSVSFNLLLYTLA